MATQTHRYDHPAYITRQTIMLGASAAGASGTYAQFIFPHAVKLHRVSGVVRIAGTTATNTYTIRGGAAGTTSLGLITHADSAAGFEATTGDLAATIAQGDRLNILGGTDATGVSAFAAEISIPVGTALTV